MKISIVMYHYVRDVADTRWARMNVRTRAEFRAQLDHIGERYTVVSMDQVFDAVMNGTPLPNNPLLLTFDDGLREHHQFVLPELQWRGWRAAFFPVVAATRERLPLAPHMIHAILASANARLLAAEIRARVEAEAPRLHIADVAGWCQRLSQATRYDTAETVFVKRALQTALPAEMRQRLLGEFFAAHVRLPLMSWANELYMTEAELRELVAAGMYVGGHTFSHPWLSACTPAQQQREIDQTRRFLIELGAIRSDGRWAMAYPYGAYDAVTLRLAAAERVALGLTTRVAPADISRDARLTLPRLDTNDLPCALGSATESLVAP